MFMHRIKLENILSFGPDAQELELRPLNVLIGPNGSGKSNLIEVIGLLGAAPRDITAPIREGGGGDNWIWRGEPKATEARVEVVVEPRFYPAKKGQRVRYSLGFGPFFFGMPNLKEEIGAVEQAERGEDSSERYLTRSSGKVILRYRDESGKRRQRELPPADIKHDQSILSQLKEPVQYPELTFLGIELAGIHLYREWSFGRNTPPRLPTSSPMMKTSGSRSISSKMASLTASMTDFSGNALLQRA